MDRRDFIKTALLTLPGLAMAAPWWRWDKKKFLRYIGGTLPIPSLARYRVEGGKKIFDMNIKESTHTFFQGVETKTYGINSSYLGETLLFHPGDDVILRFRNELDEPTTMHGHGMHVPARMDGGPHQVIAPSKVWEARYKVQQSAAMNWYHPHLMGKTAEQVYMGLAGLIYIQDDLPLPKNYGIDDIPLVLQERRFADGQIDYSPSRMDIMRGYRGGELLVNGKVAPTKNIFHRFVRFRILNGSNASMFRIAFENRLPFYIIAGDNSFLERPSIESEVLLSPAERVEIVVDLSQFEEQRLKLVETQSSRTILDLNIFSNLQPNIEAIPQNLIHFEQMESPLFTRRFELGMRRMRLTINGKTMDMSRIDERVPLGRPEIWEVVNPTRMEHNFHIHATHFRLIERNGSEENLRPHERCYKDTVYLAPGDRVKFYVKMVDFADAKNPYMYHCHFLEHEDNGMMGQFVVI